MKTANYQASLSNWQIELANVITDPRELLSQLDLDPKLYLDMLFANKDFPLRVPRGYLARMEKGNIHDPLLLQVLPNRIELQKFPGYQLDSLQEKQKNPVPGILHKYQDRALLITTRACAIHCRYCFRRHFPYEENQLGQADWEQAIGYLKTQPEIKEVILSGGDPLILKDNYLALLINKLANISHIRRLRFHSRIPIVLPERITHEFLNAISETRLQLIMVIHCNHGNEIDEKVKQALERLRLRNILLLNQSVLLKGVNDSVSALIHLSETLSASGVMPYYLHLLDKVQGAAHFDIEEVTAKMLIKEMMQQMPGYLVPKLVREIPGAASKIPVAIFSQ